MKQSFRAFVLAIGALSCAAHSAGAQSLEPGTPDSSPPTAGSNVQLGSYTGIASVTVDWESENGNLFATIRESATGNVRVLYSTDGGRNWPTAGTACCASLHDAVTAASFLYLGYVGSDPSIAMLMRASSSTGAWDASYSESVVDVSPATIEEIALMANSDDSDYLLWYFVLSSDHRIWVFYCIADSCTSLPEVSPDVTDAKSGLSAAWNTGYPDHTDSGVWFLFSYVTTSDEIKVYRYQTPAGWLSPTTVQSGATFAETTSVSAFHDRFAVAFEHPDIEGLQDAKYWRSSNGGSTWITGLLGDASLTGASYYTPMVSARSSGLASLAQQDTPGDDTYWFREMRSYLVPWTAETAMNDNDFSYGPAAFWFDFRWMGSGWGIAYRCSENKAWFAWSTAIRSSGFEVAGLDEWDAAVGGP